VIPLRRAPPSPWPRPPSSGGCSQGSASSRSMVPCLARG
jgi:hypothetical protein